MAEYEKKNVSSGNTFFQSITNVGKLGVLPDRPAALQENS